MSSCVVQQLIQPGKVACIALQYCELHLQQTTGQHNHNILVRHGARSEDARSKEVKACSTCTRQDTETASWTCFAALCCYRYAGEMPVLHATHAGHSA